MHESNGNYKNLIQDFFIEFIINNLEELIKEVEGKIESGDSYSSVMDTLSNKYNEISNRIIGKIDELIYDDKFLGILFQKLQQYILNALDRFHEELRNILLFMNNHFCGYHKSLLSELFELNELLFYEESDKLNKLIELMIKSTINDLNEIQQFLEKKSMIKRNFHELFNNVYSTIDRELYYIVSTFILFQKLKKYIIEDREDGKEKYKFLKINGSWIDKKHNISLHQCLYEILNKMSNSTKNKNIRTVLLKILNNDELLKDLIAKETIEEYHKKLHREGPEKSESFLLNILCKHLKYRNTDRYELSEILNAYFLPIFKKNELYYDEKSKLLKYLFIEKHILELDVFEYLSRLGLPSAININIYNREKTYIGEIDVVTLRERNGEIKDLFLIEVTTEKDLDKKINELEQKIEGAGSLIDVYCKGIIIYAEENLPKEKDGIFLIPFITYDKELQEVLYNS